MAEPEKCNVCNAEFKAGLEDGVCFMCKKLWPGAKTPEDRNKAVKAEVDSQEAHVKSMIVQEIDAALEKYGLLDRCVCGKLYHKRSGAQKSCGCLSVKSDK
jgi:hypothetical protein